MVVTVCTEFNVMLIAGKLVENERLYGPASLKDKTLIYPCEEFRCRVGCACKMCRNKLTHCEDFEDHEAFHRANHTQCRYCNNLESVIPNFHYKVVYEKVYYSAVRPQFERFWVKLGCASLFSHEYGWHLNPPKKNSVYHCDKCDKTFKSVSHVKRHEISVHFSKKETCPHCGLQCSRKDNLEAHIMLVHEIDRESPFQCDDCQETFDKKSNFECHSRYLKTNCSICSAIFCTLKQLQQHRLISHPKHECQKCERNFQDKAHLDRHIKANRPSLKCDVCNQEFCTTVDLKKHMRGHGQENYECSFCHKRLSTKFNLQTHIANRSDHKCDQCDQMFCNKQNFNMHYIEVHDVKTHEICCKTCHMYSVHQQLA